MILKGVKIVIMENIYQELEKAEMASREKKKQSKKKRKWVEIEESEVSDNEEHHSDEEDQIASQESSTLDCHIVAQNKIIDFSIGHFSPTDLVRASNNTINICNKDGYS